MEVNGHSRITKCKSLAYFPLRRKAFARPHNRKPRAAQSHTKGGQVYGRFQPLGHRELKPWRFASAPRFIP